MSSDTSNDLDDCVNGNIGRRTACILTYGGSGIDIWMNYSVLFVNLAFLWCQRSRKPSAWWSLAALAFTVGFQIILCLVLGCSGISIIWCAMAGWIVWQRRQQQPSPLPILELLVLSLDLAVVLYYFFVSEIITTVAHICAFIMGALLAILVRHATNDATTHESPNSVPSSVSPLVDSTVIRKKKD